MPVSASASAATGTPLPPFTADDFDEATQFLCDNAAKAAQALSLSSSASEPASAVAVTATDEHAVRQLAELNDARGKTSFVNGDLDAAFASYSAAATLLAAHPSVRPSDEAVVKAVNNLALVTKKQGKLQQCVRFCEKVISSGTQDAEALKKALWRRTQAVHELGDIDTCRKYLHELLEIHPDFRLAQKMRKKLARIESQSPASSDSPTTAGAASDHPSARPIDSPSATSASAQSGDDSAVRAASGAASLDAHSAGKPSSSPKPQQEMQVKSVKSPPGKSAAQEFCFVCDAPTKAFCTRCRDVFYCSVQCQRLHWVAGHHRRCCGRIARARVFSLRGVKGIYNSGNTCYMAAALQCLLHTPGDFKNYFVRPADATTQLALAKKHKKRFTAFEHDLNTESIHGSKGVFVTAFADFFREYWLDAQRATMSLGRLKGSFSQFRTAFRGFSQEDSLECFSSLLDLVHEDVNLIKKKKYVEHDDSAAEDRPASRRAWGLHKLRNDSKIVELFHGQFKSKLVCPTCDKVSVSFEALSTLGIEITDPPAMAAIETSPATRPGHVHRIVTLLQQSDAKTETNNDDAAGGCTNRCTSFAVEVLARGTIRDLKKQLSRMSGVPVENLLILDIFNGSVYNEFNDRDPVQHIRDKDRALAFELPASIDDPEWAHVVVHQREEVEIGQRMPAVSSTDNGVVPATVVESRVLRMSDPVVVSFRAGTATVADFVRICGAQLSAVVNEDALPRHTPAADDVGLRNSDAENHVLSALGDGSATLRISVASTRDTKTVVFTPLHELVTGSERVDECLALDVIPKSALLPSALGGEVRRTDDGHMTYFRGPNNPPGCRQVCVQFKVGCAPVPASPPQYSIDASLSKFSAALARERKQRAASTVQQQALTLTDLLRNLDLPEKLDGDNMWYCNSCKEHKEATKRMSVSMLPKVLVLHLKRFRFRNSVFSDKINRFVDFPTEGLDMAPFVTFHRDSSGTSVPNSPAAAGDGGPSGNGGEEGALANSLYPETTEAAPIAQQGDSDKELLNNKELKDYRASLDTWRHKKLRKYDTDPGFRAKRDAKKGGREEYIAFLEATVASKMKAALKDRRKRVRKATKEFDALVHKLMENADLSRVSATTRARQHFLNLGRTDLLHLVFDERKLEIQQREAAAAAAAADDDEDVAVVDENGLSMFTPPCTVYDLYAVCNHYGRGLNYGHYTATARHISSTTAIDCGEEAVDSSVDGPASNLRYGPWVSFDDDVVRTERTPVTSAAYYLCYVRRDCVAKLGFL